MNHMKPSNMFANITEEEFNRKEAEKNLYKLELRQQIEATQQRKADEKQKKMMQDYNEE